MLMPFLFIFLEGALPGCSVIIILMSVSLGLYFRISGQIISILQYLCYAKSLNLSLQVKTPEVRRQA